MRYTLNINLGMKISNSHTVYNIIYMNQCKLNKRNYKNTEITLDQ